MTEDDLDEWRANPVTEAVFAAMAAYRRRAREHWLRASWEGGETSPELLADLRARAETVEQWTSITAEQIEAELKDGQHERHSSGRVQGVDSAD